MNAARTVLFGALVAALVGCTSPSIPNPTPPIPNPDFSLALTTANTTIVQGATSTFSLNFTHEGSFAGAISISVEGLPTGVTAAIGPNPVTGLSATLRLDVAANAEIKEHPLTIKGVSGKLSKTANLMLKVVAAPPTPDFGLSVEPISTIITQGDSDTLSIGIQRLNGFAEPVTLSLEGAPAGVNASFDPAQTSGDASTLTLSVAPSVAAKNYPLVIKGTSSKLSKSINTTLSVRVPTNNSTAPKVSLATSSTNVVLSGDFTLNATASDDGEVSKVEFYLVKATGNLRLGVDTTPADGFKHTMKLTSANNGKLDFIAKAIDNAKNATTSDLVSVDVFITVAQSLDLSFGDGGKVAADFGNDDFGTDIAIQADGKIVIVGYSDTNPGPDFHSDFVVLRYTPDGSPDPTFGIGGKQTTHFDINFESAHAVAIQADGKIVVVGSAYGGTIYSNNMFAIARYNPDGSLDPSFDGDGKLTVNITTVETEYAHLTSDIDSASAVVIQPDKKIVVAGNSIKGQFALVRLSPGGSLDTSFGGDGIVTTNTYFEGSQLYDMALDSSGRIVVVGSIGSIVDGYATTNFGAVRYTPTGGLDRVFGGDGIVVTDFGSYFDEAYAVAIQPDGKIVLAGRERDGNAGRYKVALVRYTPAGSLDTTFDGDGKLTTSVGSYDDQAYDLALQPDGKIVVVGVTDKGLASTDKSDIALLRFNPGGSLDNSFYGNGKVSASIGTLSDVAAAVALQADGKIVVGGTSKNVGTNSDFALSRHNP